MRKPSGWSCRGQRQLIRIHHVPQQQAAGAELSQVERRAGPGVACTRRNCNATGGPRIPGPGALQSTPASKTLDVYKLKVCNHIRACSQWPVLAFLPNCCSFITWRALLLRLRCFFVILLAPLVPRSRSMTARTSLVPVAEIGGSAALCFLRALGTGACPWWALHWAFMIKLLYCWRADVLGKPW